MRIQDIFRERRLRWPNDYEKLVRLLLAENEGLRATIKTLRPVGREEKRSGVVLRGLCDSGI